ncbi:MFS transporter [Halioglobus maricola]|nr:MFS transporter [Halioglobus maricola]
MCVSVAPLYLTSFSIFLLPISEEFAWSRGQMSALFAATAFSIGIASPLVGLLMKRLGIRRVLLIGVFSLSACILVISRLPGSFPFYLFITTLVGFAGAATNTFVYVSILPQWFTGRLGMMMGIAMTGIGIGQTIMPVLSQFLIESLGWRNAYACLALLPMLIALPCIVFLIKEKPAPAIQDKSQLERELSLRNILTSMPFLLLGFSFLIIAVVASGVGLHTVPILIDRGLTPMQAASIAAASGIAVFVGRLGAGVLLDYLGARIVGAGIFAAATLAPLLLTSYAPEILLFLVPVLLGLALGAEGDLMPFSVRKRFGLDNYSVIYSWLFLMFNAGIMLGPLVMGLYYDYAADYNGILFAISGMVFVSYPLFWAAIGGPESELPAEPVTRTI